MLNKGVLTFTGGRIRNTIAAPTNFSAGVPLVGSLLSLAAGVVTGYNHGEPHIATLQLAKGDATPVAYAQGPLPISANGGVSVDEAGAITHYKAGLPFTAAGALATATPE
jgi:hypothetical protein